jgi:hypothetical protein
MNKKRTPSHRKIVGQFTPRMIEMLRSPAMRALSLSGRRILDRIEIEFASHGGRDNGKLPVTFADFEKYGIERHAIGPGLREVSALGLHELTRQGRAGNREFRTPNLHRLTYLPANGKPPTNEWRRIETIEEAEHIARKVRRTIKSRRRKKQNTSAGKPTETGGENPPDFGAGKPTDRPEFSVRENPPLSRYLAIYPAAGLSRDQPHSRQRASKRAARHGGPVTFHCTNNKGDHHDEDE